MLKKSKIRRYITLIKSLRNWKKYWLNKLWKTDCVAYTTRNKRLMFEVPLPLGGIFKEIFLDEFYDLTHIKSATDRSSVVFDIGANAGFFTIFIAEKIYPKEIHCFEPFPNNFRLLERNLKPLQNRNGAVYLNNIAVTGPGKPAIELFFNENSSFSPTASTLAGIDTQTRKINVQAIDLEKYCSEKKIKTIDLLKVDCEGAEYAIFYNLTTSFFLKIKALYLETHDLDTHKNNTHALAEYFKQMGYLTEIEPINDHTAMVWAVHTRRI